MKLPVRHPWSSRTWPISLELYPGVGTSRCRPRTRHTTIQITNRCTTTLPPTDYISYAIGVALGRFGANGEGILNEAPAWRSRLVFSISLHYSDNDSLQHPACQPITDAWTRYGDTIARGTSLRTWLRQSFFSDVHLGMYDNRPIYFPLSSQRKNFVALVSIHRWADNTLQTLLAEYLFPELHQIEGELHDLMAARNQSDRKAQAEAENTLQQGQGTLR